MFTELHTELIVWRAWLTATVRDHRLRDDRGEITQTVIIIAVLSAAAIAILAIIVTKFTSKAQSIPTD